MNRGDSKSFLFVKELPLDMSNFVSFLRLMLSHKLVFLGLMRNLKSRNSFFKKKISMLYSISLGYEVRRMFRD